jgi:hypothetical protein
MAQGTKRRSCTGKQGHASRAAAERARGKLAAERGARGLDVYQCDFCRWEQQGYLRAIRMLPGSRPRYPAADVDALLRGGPC